ncbi:MAG: radical SAM protein [Fibrobacterota bacterium]
MALGYHHLFGPVPSRRLGCSLGVDLVPYKVCSFDCVYCECGKTTERTTERSEYVPVYRVIEELKDFLKAPPCDIDYITFSGSGEPTLNKGIGGVIEFLKQNYPEYKVALLTNSSLFMHPEMRNEVLRCDLVVPSLDAVSSKVFQQVNRPAPGIKPRDLVNALCDFRDEFDGCMWLEIFIVPGVNDTPQELDLLSKAAERIAPDKIQLNFLDRPGTEPWVRKPTPEETTRILGFFKRLSVEIIAPTPVKKGNRAELDEVNERLLALIRRRPCTAADLVTALGRTEKAINQRLDALIESGQAEFVTEERGVFFRAR